MSNLTLKEQLEALSLGSSEKPSVPPKTLKSNYKTPTKMNRPPKQKPAWLEHAQYGVELLRAYFPACFKEMKEIQPLKIGIKQDLVKHLSTRDDVVLGDKACMVSSLAYYVSSAAYHKNVIEGAARIDLEGIATGVVTADEAQYSVECRKTKLQKKNKELETTEKS
ncbi:MAG TPA: ProQ/FinO family protein [Gammaproteobacteria bacterium]|jgi:ProP effector|nr:ProQ/FinO family protein [Gammaproteobacteria bacterium]